MRTSFPDPDNILNFNLDIEPDEGMYKGGLFKFEFKINQNFPHDPPKVKCTQLIYHPNIDLEGNVCLNILREDWKPVLNLNAVMVGLQVCILDEAPEIHPDLHCNSSFCSWNPIPRIRSTRTPPRTSRTPARPSSATYGAR